MENTGSVKIAPATQHRALSRDERDYGLLFDVSAEPTIIIGEDGKYLDYNHAYVQLMGHVDKSNLLNFHPANVSPPSQPDGQDSFSKANEMMRLAYAKGEHSFEWAHRRPDGNEFISHVTLRSINFQGKKCIHAVIHDLSETKKMERLVGEKTRELSEKNRELSEALQRVKQLSGLLPICAGCKKIRDDKGYWTQIESYIRDHSDADFSHGLCPECAERLYPEAYQKLQKK